MCFIGRKSDSYSWLVEGGNAFKGFIIYGDMIYRGEIALDFMIKEIVNKSDEEIKIFLNELDGTFAFYIESSEKVYFGVDRVRSMPLFYTYTNGVLYVGDDAEKITQKNCPIQVNELSIEEFNDSQILVIGNKTLIKDLFQVRAAEIVIYNKSDKLLSNVNYYNWDEMFREYAVDEKQLRNGFDKVYYELGKEIVALLNGRTAVIPLSGGADSRMIVKMLRNQSYEKVICFSYGRKGNKEAKISEKVAKMYGYPWHFVEYKNKAIREQRKSNELKDYMRMASGFSSLPHVQDYYAVRVLKENKIIPEDSVFIPGHGEPLTGCHLKEMYLHKNVALQEALNSMLEYCCYGNKEKYVNNLKEEYLIHEEMNGLQYASKEFQIDITERQAKFINNSVRVYEFWGYEWLMPLWSKKLFDYWKLVPPDIRYGRGFYYSMVKDGQKSTNDVTKAKMVKRIFKKSDFMYKYGVFIRNCLDRWFSLTNNCRLFSFGEYFKVCLSTNPFEFGFVKLWSRYYINEVLKNMF